MNKQTFAPLVFLDGKDSWDALATLKCDDVMQFEGESARFGNIWEFVQHLVSDRGVFVGGDMVFVAHTLGLMGAASHHPCVICSVNKNDLHSEAPARGAANNPSSHPAHFALLDVPPERIVPLPLHTWLGICNKLIKETFAGLIGEEFVKDSIARVKQSHSRGCGGRASAMSLNGPEVAKWLRSGECDKMLDMRDGGNPFLEQEIRQRATRMRGWMEELKDLLLFAADITTESLTRLQALAHEIWRHWTAYTGCAPLPKTHMLVHIYGSRSASALSAR